MGTPIGAGRRRQLGQRHHSPGSHWIGTSVLHPPFEAFTAGRPIGGGGRSEGTNHQRDSKKLCLTVEAIVVASQFFASSFDIESPGRKAKPLGGPR